MIVAVLTALVLAGVAAAQAATLSGRVEVVDRDGRRRPAEGAVVWVPGTAPATAAPASVASRDKRFDPHVLAVVSGALVQFPNADPIHHNVFSLTPGSAFDLGLYRKGASRKVRFTRPGLVRIYCNIHAQMAAYIMVLDAAHAVTGAGGAFRIDGLPEGRREVRVWHVRAGETSVAVDLPAADGLTLTLDASRYREQPHKNKYGEDYPPPGRDVDRY